MGFLRSTFLIFLLIPAYLTSLKCQHKADSLINSATLKIHAGKLQDAAEDLRVVLSHEPTNSTALNGEVIILFLRGNVREADRKINRLIDLNPGYAGFYLTRGIILNQRGNWRRALTDLDRARELKASNLTEIYLHRGISKIHLNRNQSAIEDFSSALENDPSNIYAYNYRGMINYREGRYEEAIMDFNRVIILSPGNGVAYYNRAMAFLRAGRIPEACMDFHESCRSGNRNACQMIIMECQLGFLQPRY